MKWEVVIGLETHAQLQTKSKIFCGASTAFGAEPNTQADAVSLALPGVLPVLNREAVVCAIKFGLAIDAHITDRSVFARKNYFYPDLPKGYQISQMDLPVVAGGSITINVNGEDKVVRLTRAHLEEDAGKSLHEDFHGKSGIDLNRAGTPLLEIVSEPDMRSAAEAVAYAKKLHELVQWIGICDGNMQEGSFRCDANVSVRRPGEPFGTRREIKNLNSFRFLEQAINYEVQWQINEIEEGRKIQQATVLFDPDTGETRMMRSKEDAHDYRYFPDPDLLPVEITEAWKAEVKAGMPELPQAMQQRFTAEYGLSAYDAAIITSSREMAQYFLDTVALAGPANAKQCANWIMGELSSYLNKGQLSVGQAFVGPEVIAEIILRISQGQISNSGGKKLFAKFWEREQRHFDDLVATFEQIIKDEDLAQLSDSSAIEAIIDEVLAANQKSVEEFRAGKEKAFNALVGQAMKATKGKANPQQVNDLLKKKLGA